MGGWALDCELSRRYAKDLRWHFQRGHLTHRLHHTKNDMHGTWEAHEVTDKGLKWLREQDPEEADRAERIRAFYRDWKSRCDALD